MKTMRSRIENSVYPTIFLILEQILGVILKEECLARLLRDGT